MAIDAKYAPIANAIQQGLKNVDKYYKKTTDSDVYFICLGGCFMFLLWLFLILCKFWTLTNKLAYVDGRWSRQELASGRTCLDATVSIH